MGIGRWCAMLAALAVLAPATAEAARTVVTLSFDDAVVSQLEAQAILEEYGVRGSFFVNSNRVGRSGRLTWDEVRALAAAGHEVGGHTLDHEDVTEVSLSEARRQICDDHDAIVAQGLTPTTFAYPFGHSDAAAAQILADCGYVYARKHGGLRSLTGCSSCPPAESLTPPDPLQLRSPQSVRDTYTLGDLQTFVLRAEAGGGGWLNYNFHEVLEDCSGETYCIETDLLRSFLDWLLPRSALGTVVLPMGEAFGPAAPDETAPLVVIAAPVSGQTVRGTVSITASASDDVRVEGVDFHVNGALVARDLAAPYVASWDTRALPNGPATLEAQAFDAAGNVGFSAPVVVTIDNDGTPPLVALTAPADGAIVSGLVPLTANASDASGIARVEFLVDGTVIGSDTSAPYAITWDSRSLPNGARTLRARAVDANGNSALSDPRTVQVANTGPVNVRMPFGSVWSYWDAGTDPGAGWHLPAYDDAAWPSGAGQLGYGDRDEATLLRRTSPSQTSVYFRRHVALSGTPTAATISLVYDDGIAVFVNGTLVVSRHVDRPLDHTRTARASTENERLTATIPASAFRAGDNVIAVVVKQVGPTSPDLSFDMQLDVTAQ